MLLTGSHGVGKTTIAQAFLKEMKAETLFLNCSKNNSIDDVRTKIYNFASSMSLYGEGLKVVLGDEFDYFGQAGQAALRGVIEQVSKNCRFIFTCNFPNKIIAPLQSRLLLVDFKIQPKDKPELAKQFMKRCCNILDQEGVKYEKQVLAMLIQKQFPDFRKVIQMLQHSSLVGELTIEALDKSDGDFGPYIVALKAKDYKAARTWIGQNAVDASDFFHTLFMKVNEIFTKDSLAQAILILHNAQVNHAVVVDEELSLSALTIELMSQCSFQK